MSAVGIWVLAGALALGLFTKQRGAALVVFALAVLLILWPLAEGVGRVAAR